MFSELFSQPTAMLDKNLKSNRRLNTTLLTIMTVLIGLSIPYHVVLMTHRVPNQVQNIMPVMDTIVRHLAAGEKISDAMKFIPAPQQVGEIDWQGILAVIGGLIGLVGVLLYGTAQNKKMENIAANNVLNVTKGNANPS